MREFICRLARRLLAATLALGLASPVLAVSTTYRIQPGGGKVAYHDSLKASAGSIPSVGIAVAAVRAEEIQAVREENSSGARKALIIGIGRDVAPSVESGSAALAWTAVPGGAVAHWRVTSPGAEALRVGLDVARLAPGAELRFLGSGSAIAYGPFTGAEVSEAVGAVYWSPVLEGDTVTVEVFTRNANEPSFDVGLQVVQVSHLFVSAMNPRVGSLAKASGACEVDLVCLSASDTALANAGRATAQMTITDGSGSTALCTGTLLNTIGGTGQNYFFTANHCFNEGGRAEQSTVSTISTTWSYERSACGGGSVGSLQIGGGGRLLYADAPTDVVLLRLNRTPPPGAVFSGWDANAVALGTRLWAVHHPSGDVKKVSLGSMGGYAANLGGAAGNTLMTVLWDGTATGVTEGGSSGSGIFSAVGAPATEYRLRGGLFGGPSSCAATGSALRDYYSRLDTNYAYLDQYLNPGSSCAQTLSASSLSVPGEGGATSITVATSGSCGWSAASEVDWVSTSSAAIGSGTAQFTVSPNTTGATRTGALIVGKQSVTITQPASTVASSELLANPGFESGSTGWVQSPANIITTAASAGVPARSGVGLAWLSGYNNANDLLYQQVTIPSDATSAVFSFWYRITTEELPVGDYDFMRVTVNNASGTALGSVVSLSNRNATSGWVQSSSFDLSQFRGQTIRLTFQATSDPSLITSFFVDDVSLAITRGSSVIEPTGFWSGVGESGWGLNFNLQGDSLLGAVYSYDTDGSPLWLVLSVGTRSGNSYTGPLYRSTGPVFSASPWVWSPAANLQQVGTMTVNFTSANAGTLSYSVNGVTVNKSISKFSFGSPVTTCTQTSGSRAGLTNYQDVWESAPAGSEPGWGLAVAQEGGVVSAGLYTYGTDGKTLWLLLSPGIRQADGSFSGNLYSPRGPAFNTTPWPSGSVVIGNPVGTMTLRFTNGDTGTLSYTVNGVTVNKNITRNVFGSTRPACQ